MNYYLIKRKENKAGVPTFINGVLSEKFDINNPMPPMNYDWLRKTPIGRKEILPSKLCLIVKNKLIRSDYINDFHGFIVSEQFLSIIEEARGKLFDKAQLDVIGWKGNKVTDNKYYYIDYLFPNRVDAVDYEKSLFAFDSQELRYDKKEIGALNKDDYLRYIKGFKKLYLKDTEYDVFQLNISCASGFLFCNDTLREKIISKKLYGIDFIQLPDVEKVFNFQYNYGEITWNK